MMHIDAAKRHDHMDYDVTFEQDYQTRKVIIYFNTGLESFNQSLKQIP